jgi:hypothetical protein
MERLLRYPPSLPLVHVDHSHRLAVLGTWGERRGCVEEVNYDGDGTERHCSVPVYGLNGNLISYMPIDNPIGEGDNLGAQVDYLTSQMEAQGAHFAIVYYATTESWRSVIKITDMNTMRQRVTFDVAELRKYLNEQIESNEFQIRLSNDPHAPKIS